MYRAADPRSCSSLFFMYFNDRYLSMMAVVMKRVSGNILNFKWMSTSQSKRTTRIESFISVCFSRQLCICAVLLYSCSMIPIASSKYYVRPSFKLCCCSSFSLLNLCLCICCEMLGCMCGCWMLGCMSAAREWLWWWGCCCEYLSCGWAGRLCISLPNNLSNDYIICQQSIIFLTDKQQVIKIMIFLYFLLIIVKPFWIGS